MRIIFRRYSENRNPIYQCHLPKTGLVWYIDHTGYRHCYQLSTLCCKFPFQIDWCSFAENGVTADVKYHIWYFLRTLYCTFSISIDVKRCFNLLRASPVYMLDPNIAVTLSADHNPSSNGARTAAGPIPNETLNIPSHLFWLLPWKQGSWGQHGAHLRPTGSRWAPYWPYELCYLGMLANTISMKKKHHFKIIACHQAVI